MDENVSLFVAKREDVNPKEGEGKYGDVKYADAKNKKYPIDTEEHIRAAWSYINQAGNASKYSSEDVKSMKSAIVSAWKDKIDKGGPPSAENNDAGYLMDEFGFVNPGEPFRLMPFGTVVKNGVKHFITPASAATMKLPHWKPAIKLGSHEETTPAGGQITGLEVRNDGLYAIPEFTAKGMKSITDGDYRYESPEILWENGVLENPQTGELMPGPFVVGVALLHNPHLGDSAALYSYEPISKGANMEEEVKISKSLWDQLSAVFGKKPEAPAPVIDPEQFAATVKERDEMKANLAKLEADKQHGAQVEQMVTELKTEKYGQLFKADTFAAEAAEVFTAVPEKERGWILQKFAALSAQVNLTKILTEFGQTGASSASDPAQEFAAVVANTMKEQKVDYVAAFGLARTAHPEMAAAYDQAAKQIKKE